MATEKLPAEIAATAAPINVAATAAPINVAATNFDLTLDEFCRRLSGKITAPELIGGFNHAQTAAGQVKGSEASFAAAFDAFSKQPA